MSSLHTLRNDLCLGQKLLIVLGGIDGTGKTTLAEGLSDKLGIPVVRAFRGVSKPDRRLIERAGLSVNDFHEDFYFSDLFRQAPFSAIFDRSFLCALAYRYAAGTLEGAQEQLSRVWAGNLESHRGGNVVVLFILLVASHRECLDRLKQNPDKAWKLNMFTHGQFTRLTEYYAKVWPPPSGFPWSTIIPTYECDAEWVLGAAMRWIEKVCSEST